MVSEHSPGDSHEDEARERWGSTTAYQESKRRMAEYSPADMDLAKHAQEEALQGVIEVMDQGFPATSLEAMVAADRCRQAISAWYFECSPDMHAQLAEMYVSDERFRTLYESHRPGLAQYFHDAILAGRSGPRD
jgi:hypothetical protein